MHSAHRELVNATRNVLNADSASSVIDRILLSAQSLLAAEAASVFLVNRRRRRLEMSASTNLSQRVEKSIHLPIDKGVAGWVVRNKQLVLVDDLTSDPRYYHGVSEQTRFQTRGYICVPLAVNGTVMGTIQVLNRNSGSSFSAQHGELLQAFAVLASLALEKSRLHASELERRRMQSELQVAKAFQESLLPASFSPPEGYRIGSYYKAARSMGGDFFDAMPVNGQYLVALGDVSGKGPGAAIWMSGFANVLRYVVREGRDPVDHLPDIDRHLAATLPATSFLTLFMAMIDGDTLRYTSAGHNPMLLMHPDGQHQWLDATGLPLSLLPDMPREIRTVTIPAGARLVLFSDGVTEAERPSGEMYGEERLLRIVSRNRDLEPDELIARIVRSVKRFAHGVPQSDDIAMMVLAH